MYLAFTALLHCPDASHGPDLGSLLNREDSLLFHSVWGVHWNKLFSNICDEFTENLDHILKQSHKQKRGTFLCHQQKNEPLPRSYLEWENTRLIPLNTAVWKKCRNRKEHLGACQDHTVLLQHALSQYSWGAAAGHTQQFHALSSPAAELCQWCLQFHRRHFCLVTAHKNNNFVENTNHNQVFWIPCLDYYEK